MAIKTYYLVKKFIDNRTIPFYIEDVTGASGNYAMFKKVLADISDVEYSTDMVTWTTMPSRSSDFYGAEIPANGRVYIRSTGTTFGDYQIARGLIHGSNNYNVGGNIMSLLYGSNFVGNETSFPNPSVNNVFRNLFMDGYAYSTTGLIDASMLYLPVTTLTKQCYAGMFQGQKFMTKAPELPATTLADHCYSNMFNGCTALINAPTKLPATTLPQNCYYGMFYGCTSLTTAPEMFFAYVGYSSCTMMFYNCSNLNEITVHATGWVDGYASNWVSGVSATGTFTKPSGTTISEGTSGIPSGWTVVNV